MINDKKKVGLIVAIETDSIFDYYGRIERLECPVGFQLYRTESGNAVIYILKTGMGEIAAASGTQYLITRFDIGIIVNFGVVGGLTEEMKKCRLCVVERVVHYRYDCSEFLDLKVGQVDGYDSLYLPTDAGLAEKAKKLCPEIIGVTCCSGDKFISGEAEKRSIHEQFAGDICEMEAAGILLTCRTNKVPCLLLKAVSDSLSGGSGEFFDALRDASLQCLKVTDKIISTL